MATIDANCWIATRDPTDPFHGPSTEFFQRLSARAIRIQGPELVVVEVACALARRLRDPSRGERAEIDMRANPLLQLYPHGDRLMAEAVRIGTQRFLRGADALYVAVAQLTGTQLVTWDNELIERAGAITPTTWLDANP